MCLAAAIAAAANIHHATSLLHYLSFSAKENKVAGCPPADVRKGTENTL